MNEQEYHRLSDVAAHFGCRPRKITELARPARIGLFLGGRAGWRFTDVDVQQLAELMRAKPLPKRDRRSRRAA